MFSALMLFLMFLAVVVAWFCRDDLIVFLKTRRWQRRAAIITFVQRTDAPHPANHMFAPHQKRMLTFFECHYSYEEQGEAYSRKALIPLDDFNVIEPIVAGASLPIRINPDNKAESLMDPQFPHAIWFALALMAGPICSSIGGVGR